MAVKILTPDYEIHIEGVDTHYKPHMKLQLESLVGSIEKAVARNDLDYEVKFKFGDKQTFKDCCYIKKTIGDDDKMRIILQISDPDEFITVIDSKYGTLIPTDKSKQQLLDLLQRGDEI